MLPLRRHAGSFLLGGLVACGASGPGRIDDAGRPSGTETTPATDGHADDADGDDADDTDPGDDDDGDDATTGGAIANVRFLELAGHTLPSAPWFRTVDDFHDDAAVEIAIDPRRFADLEGSTCEVYVVAARDAAAWQADAILIDVREAGPSSMTIAGELADNRTVVAAAGTLSSDAGAGLGVAYDVVLDCNRNGLLDAGDVIDGASRPGLYRTHDATSPGPLAVSMVAYSGGSWLGQRTFYPTAIAQMDALPLVVVTHGWSYAASHYDYIGEHLASYGYVVMAHDADVQDGGPSATHAAAATTLDNTEYFLANLATIADGVLDGHVDPHRIMWTGHSTGGEAVVRAYTQLRDGSFSSPWFSADDIRVISSMAPVSWHARTLVDPGDVAYHMFLAGADDDVSGAPLAWYTQPRSIFERATGPRQLTYIHGAGHGDLVSCCGPAFLDVGAPDLIGRSETNVVARGTFLALAELYLRDNAAALELFSRAYADHHPPGIADHVVVTNEYHAPRSRVLVLDDFQSAPELDRSSAGGEVVFDVTNAAEVLMQDNDGSFAWTGSQPSNGMTHARHAGDDPRALVFDFGPDEHRYYEQRLPAGMHDVSAFDALSLRACQGTRHPHTVALAGPLSFTVTLRDEDGRTASIGLAGIAEIPAPYARTGEGAGSGWQNEMSTVKLRLNDFVAATPDLDLSRIAAVRLDFGPGYGSSPGRLGLDDIELVD